MSKLIDLVGARFGRLVVLKRVENDQHGHARWQCRCGCGRGTVALTSHLRSGRRTSCGCARSKPPRGAQKLTSLIRRDAMRNGPAPPDALEELLGRRSSE